MRRQERVSRQQADQDARLRYLWMGWDEERRFLRLEGELPAEQGAQVEAALERKAEEIVLEPGPLLDPRGARLADALTELVACSGEATGGASLVVHTDVAVLAGAPEGVDPHLAETESGVRLADETVRRLACDAIVEWAVEAGGIPIGVGRRSRSIPAWLARQLRHRDQGCRFPGCGRRGWLKAHHVWHWGAGGPTDLDNLVLLCHSHDRLVHEGAWTMSGRPSGNLRFHDPGGRSPPRRSPVASMPAA